MDIQKNFPIGSLLVSHYVDGSVRYFRVTGHTPQKVRVHQIVPYRKKGSGNTYVSEKNRLVAPEDGRVSYKGLAKVKSDDTLVWSAWHMKKWHSTSFDESCDKFA
jgi:hypothetical protein